MIRIHLSLEQLDKLAQDFYQEVQAIMDIEGRIQAVVDHYNASAEAHSLFTFLQARLKKIITARPSELEHLASQIAPLYKAVADIRKGPLSPNDKDGRAAVNKALKEEVYSIFDYPGFTGHDESSWAYKHSARLDVNVCPYCNLNFTFTVQSKNGKCRPQFDHFISKAAHPYLALSFYNLVPSCPNCNASFKGAKRFLPSTHIHPFCEGVEDCLVFKMGIDKVDYLMGNTGFNLNIAVAGGVDPAKLARANKNMTIFHWEDQYQYLKDYAGELVRRSVMYSGSRRKELVSAFPNLFKTDEHLLATLYGDSVHPEKLHRRPMAKLAYNILQELKICK